MTEVLKGILIVMAWLLLTAVLSVVPTWLLWNGIMPELFGLPKITFWQSFGLLLLTGLLITNPIRLNLEMGD